MIRRILMVDDDERILASYQRSLRLKFELEVALGGVEGLQKLQEAGPFAVVVADMQMPGMNGIHFLERVQEAAPESVRMMLTGNADQHTAVEAVNRGQIFRFLNKPCAVPDITRALEAGLEQYRLVTAERELLDKTLSGAVQVLTDLLSMADPAGFGRVEGLLDYCLTVARMLGMEDVWSLRLAAMLGQIGRLTLPQGLLDRAALGRPLGDHEKGMLAALPETSARLLSHIPRLEQVAQIVRYQHKHFDGTGFPPDDAKGEAIPLGARILGTVRAYLDLEAQAGTPAKALDTLRGLSGRHDPKVIAALLELLGPAGPPPPKPRPLGLDELEEGMVLAADVFTSSGLLLFSTGSRLGLSHIEKIQNFARLFGVRTPVMVVEEGSA